MLQYLPLYTSIQRGLTTSVTNWFSLNPILSMPVENFFYLKNVKPREKMQKLYENIHISFTFSFFISSEPFEN